MTKRLLLLSCLTLGLLAGCSSDDDKQTDLFQTYDRRGMLTSLRDKVVAPGFQDFAARATELQAAATTLTQTPTATTLAQAQTAWKAALAAWKGVVLYSFGPAEVLNTAAGVAYPANPTVIESALATTAPIDQAYVDARASSAKGLWALEYLLFRQTGGDAAVLAGLTTDAHAASRRAYLLAVAADVRLRAEAVRGDWTGGPYPQQFVEADGNDVNSSLSLLANQLVGTVEGIKNDQLGLPLGEDTGGAVQPTAVEAYESGQSVAALLATLDDVQATFQGNRVGSTPAPGIDDLLDHLGAQYNGQSLAQQILQQIATVRAKAAALPNPSLAAQLQQDPQPVRDLYTATKQLTVLLKVDMISRLGVLLTFNDNDGD